MDEQSDQINYVDYLATCYGGKKFEHKSTKLPKQTTKIKIKVAKFANYTETDLLDFFENRFHLAQKAEKISALQRIYNIERQHHTYCILDNIIINNLPKTSEGSIAGLFRCNDKKYKNLVMISKMNKLNIVKNDIGFYTLYCFYHELEHEQQYINYFKYANNFNTNALNEIQKMQAVIMTVQDLDFNNIIKDDILNNVENLFKNLDQDYYISLQEFFAESNAIMKIKSIYDKGYFHTEKKEFLLFSVANNFLNNFKIDKVLAEVEKAFFHASNLLQDRKEYFTIERLQYFKHKLTKIRNKIKDVESDMFNKLTYNNLEIASILKIGGYACTEINELNGEDNIK